MLPTGVVQLWGGPDDGRQLELHPDVLPRALDVGSGEYVRDPGLDVVRATGLPVHRYRWTGSRPPDDQVPA